MAQKEKDGIRRLRNGSKNMFECFFCGTHRAKLAEGARKIDDYLGTQVAERAFICEKCAKEAVNNFAEVKDVAKDAEQVE